MRRFRSLRSHLGSWSRRFPLVRRIIEILQHGVLRLRDDLLPVTPDNNLVVFASFSGRSISGSPLAIYEHLLTDPAFSSLRFVWAVRDREQARRASPIVDNNRTALVDYNSRQFALSMRAARVWVASTTLPEHIRRRPRQQYIQTWHGTPLKRLGRDIVTAGGRDTGHDFAGRYRRDAKRMTHLISSSLFTTKVFTSAFSLQDIGRTAIVCPCGNPRNDRLVQARQLPPERRTELTRQLRTQLGLPTYATVVLYAPTWRDAARPAAQGYPYDISLDIDRLIAHWGEDVVIAFRAHYLMRPNWSDAAASRVVDLSDVADVNDVLLACDALITDYSSVFFDFALLNKPIYFFVPDLDEYAGKARGLYLDIDELAGPVARTNEQLAALPNPQTMTPVDHSAFLARYATFDDGQSTRRIIDQVWSV